MALETRRTLLVLPNPYHALDAFGGPAGAVPYEPTESPVPVDDRRWVGVTRLETELLDTFGRGDLRSPRQHTRFVFDDAPVSLPISQYYVDRIREGALIPADERTAMAAGMRFEDPGLVAAKTVAKAAVTWKAHTGADCLP